MSYSSLYAVFKTKIRTIQEYKNGHGSAPPVWELLSSRYLPGGRPWLFGDNGALWALARDLNVPEHLRICHGMTFDRAAVSRDDLPAVAKCCREAHADILKGNWTWSHWEAIANDLDGLAAKWPARAIGISLNCTSVGDAFDGYPERGDPAFNVFTSYSTVALRSRATPTPEER